MEPNKNTLNNMVLEYMDRINAEYKGHKLF